MEIIIDKNSGFCFGVERAIKLAEKEALENKVLYCLGDIVHNSEEIKRLEKKGIRFISSMEFFTLKNCRVLIRAHGEPPETYKYALDNNIKIIDATCPVVLKLQKNVKRSAIVSEDAQVIIFGKKDHPEVIGLAGQSNKAIIIESIDEVFKINIHKPIYLFAQTTKDKLHYKAIVEAIKKKMLDANIPSDNLVVANSICGQVTNKVPHLAEFSNLVDAVLFVGGKTSSNSRMLYNICKQKNNNTFFVTSVEDAQQLHLDMYARIGICGATSTPSWLIHDIAESMHASKKQV